MVSWESGFWYFRESPMNFADQAGRLLSPGDSGPRSGPLARAPRGVGRHQLSEAEQKFAEEVYKNHGPAIDWLDRLVPHLRAHGKYWHLKDEHDDSGVPYQRILHRLTELGYSGYIACEYEGHHFRDDIDVKDQLQKVARLLTS